MMAANVYFDGYLAGTLWRDEAGLFHFKYAPLFLAADTPPVSARLPKRADTFTADKLFPFFFNMLSEGSNRKLQERIYKIEPWDHFSLLLKTAHTDTIGAVTVKAVAEIPRYV